MTVKTFAFLIHASLPFAILLFAFLIYLLIKIRKYHNKNGYLLALTVIITILIFLIYVNIRSIYSANFIAYRYYAIEDLNKIAKLQNDFYNKNGKHALYFEDIGISFIKPNYITLYSDYTFYMNEDVIWKGMPDIVSRKSEIYSININKNIIYASYTIKDIGTNILSMDYNGKIQEIQKFDYWPMPKPDR